METDTTKALAIIGLTIVAAGIVTVCVPDAGVALIETITKDSD